MTRDVDPARLVRAAVLFYRRFASRRASGTGALFPILTAEELMAQKIAVPCGEAAARFDAAAAEFDRAAFLATQKAACLREARRIVLRRRFARGGAD